MIAAVNVAEAESFVAAVEEAAPFDLRVRPWRVESTPEFAREPGLLPLWLEPGVRFVNTIRQGRRRFGVSTRSPLA